MRLKGKVAVVTGGTSGIGRRIVERFVEEGAAVVFSGRRVELGREVAEATGAAFVEADVVKEADAARTIETASRTHGTLDILVNNAGMGSPGGKIENMPLESFDEMMAVHVRGALAHMKYAAAIMRPRRSGSIINISSIGAHRVGFGSLAYSAAKAALNHVTRCAALELGEENVRVNSISPGAIATGIFGKAMGMGSDAAERSASDAKLHEALVKYQPIPRAGVPDDVANAAVWLASDESSFIAGEDIVIDGGMIRGRRRDEVRAVGKALRDILA